MFAIVFQYLESTYEITNGWGIRLPHLVFSKDFAGQEKKKANGISQYVAMRLGS